MTFILPENPVSVPSRGEWGFLPQSVVGYDLKPDMFPSPREETGGSNMNLDNELLHAVQFPYPHEVNGVSNMANEGQMFYVVVSFRPLSR